MVKQITGSILFKVLLIVVSATILVGVVTMGLLYQYLSDYHQESQLNRSLDLTRSLDAGIGALDLEDKDLLQSKIHKFVWLTPEIKKLNLYLPSKGLEEMLVSYSSDLKKKGEKGGSEVIDVYRTGEVKSEVGEGGERIVVWSPARIAGSVFGVYEIELIENEDRAAVAKLLRGVMGVILLAVVLEIVMIVIFFQLGVLRPFWRLIQRVEKVGKGDLNFKKEELGGELGRLSDVVIEIVGKLGMSQNQLEKQVEERTASLTAKTVELQRMNELMVGRELEMIKLKERIKELEGKGRGMGKKS